MCVYDLICDHQRGWSVFPSHWRCSVFTAQWSSPLRVWLLYLDRMWLLLFVGCYLNLWPVKLFKTPFSLSWVRTFWISSWHTLISNRNKKKQKEHICSREKWNEVIFFNLMVSLTGCCLISRRSQLWQSGCWEHSFGDDFRFRKLQGYHFGRYAFLISTKNPHD